LSSPQLKRVFLFQNVKLWEQYKVPGSDMGFVVRDFDMETLRSVNIFSKVSTILDRKPEGHFSFRGFSDVIFAYTTHIVSK